MIRSSLLASLFAVLVAVPSRADGPKSAPEGWKTPTPQDVEFFERRIRPVLAAHCFSCHGPQKQRAGLRLDSAAGLHEGSDNGPVVVPGKPQQSRLIKMVHGEGKKKMPPAPRSPLSATALADLTAWVAKGAPWPLDKAGPAAAGADAGKTHWAFQPVKLPALPAVKDRTWAANSIDRFILAGLEARGLTPSDPADRHALLRRLSFDLTGLPPTAAEVDAFVNDPAPNAYEKVVDRLLASPHYGERWARHWLDVARYADTLGTYIVRDNRFAYSYTYRDYVIRAFNEDLPYDRFILEQLAADRLQAEDPTLDRRSLAAMGFLTLGLRQKDKNDEIDDMIDVVTRGLLGLTVHCARCHNHKSDPIPTRDYYSLYGVFKSSRHPEYKELPLIADPERTPAYVAFEKRLNAMQELYDKLVKEGGTGKNIEQRPQRRLRKRIEALLVTSPQTPPRAMVLVDRHAPFDPYVFMRGNPTTKGPPVPRQFLAVLSGPDRQPFKHGSGRLDLARAIADPKNPLTARVLVNRVWLHHFGAGLVRTPSDFGIGGARPSHPELLDWLAWRFVQDGWSIKKLHRLILLSATYRQTSEARTDPNQIDPDNVLLWRMNRQRLDFESLRDSLLFAAGVLDRKAGGQPVDILDPPYSGRRTVYGFLSRTPLPEQFRTFDFPSPNETAGERLLTTVPQQALYLLNSPFVTQQARLLAKRSQAGGSAAPQERIGRLYRLAYSRGPDPEEVALGLQFLQGAAQIPGLGGPAAQDLGPWERYAQLLIAANEFIFID
jgi:mono/diheme cytochrome c family protein